jgi:predicted dehydrogenase
MPLNIALYGTNGHQIQNALVNNLRARLVAVAEFPREKLPEALQQDPAIRFHDNFAELVADPQVDLISLCSPWRRDQAAQAIEALRGGKHVYAEKPSALCEADLDEIIRVSHETGKLYREMAGTVFEQPYLAMRGIVKQGLLGEVVQVIAEKSYPYHGERAQDEDLDGGLIGQCAIHAVRMVEQVGGVPIRSSQAEETTLGNPDLQGGLRMAAALLFVLANGGLASVTANYLNQRGTGVWGYDSLKILGTLGLVESERCGGQTRLVIGEKDLGPVDVSEPSIDYLECFLKTILGEGEMPITLEEELSATRWVIRARESLTKKNIGNV